MECPECLRDFNEIQQLPKALPCGHTFCLECLQKVDRCYIDNKEFSDIPSELPINHNVIALIRSSETINGSSLHVWCEDCKSAASESCVDGGHKVCNRKRMWVEEALQRSVPTDGKLDMQYILKLVDDLDEAAVAEAVDMLSGKMSSLDILLHEAKTRWRATLQLADVTDEKISSMLRCLFLLMQLGGTVPKALFIPPVSEKEDTKPREKADPQSVMDLTNISYCKDQLSVQAEKMELLSANSLLKVRHITGLNCQNDKKWSLQILQRVAPFIEELHLYNFHCDHLEVVPAMPQLRWLVLEGMFRKNSKETNSNEMLDYALPVLQHKSKVEFLWLNIPTQLELAKSIVRTFQTSVQVLLTNVPDFHSEAKTFFQDLKMPNIKKLFYFSQYADPETCKHIMDDLRLMFPHKNVICFFCGRTETYDD